MPELFGQQGGQWLPSFRPGNWVSSWGARPNDFGHQTAFSYFQQNPAQMQNYNQGRLGNAFQSWFGGNQQGGPTADPRYPQTPQQPPPNPYAGALGNAGGNVGGEYIPPPTIQPPQIQNPPKYGPPGTQTQTWNRPSDPYRPPQPYEPFGNIDAGTPKFPNQPDPTTQTPQLPGRPIVNPQGTGGIGDFRRRGWF